MDWALFWWVLFPAGVNVTVAIVAVASDRLGPVICREFLCADSRYSRGLRMGSFMYWLIILAPVLSWGWLICFAVWAFTKCLQTRFFERIWRVIGKPFIWYEQAILKMAQRKE